MRRRHAQTVIGVITDPLQNWISAGQAAKQIIRKICEDEKLKPLFLKLHESNPSKIRDVYFTGWPSCRQAAQFSGKDTVDLASVTGRI